MCELLIFCVHSPLYYGIYKDKKLDSTYTLSEKTSRALLQLYTHTKKEYKIQNIYYANGPGNLSTLKLLHTFLHTWALIEDIGLFAADSFALMPNAPIYAFGNKYFVKNDEKIEFVALDMTPQCAFLFPQILNPALFDKKPEPFYVLPAI
ncbi:hypothetical protein [uncultured Helicobacter sp.]|uniref:hypothetical protein n=1 Tax=uncultured Helicobacter sp. TaxID=175537 RepID=UPI00258D79EA|nr:hypothetical protein [uncultured Helicobacter sp.]